MDRVWLLGASDPEMEEIERVLRDAEEFIAYAAVRKEDGAPRRVFPSEAYRAGEILAVDKDLEPLHQPARLVQVECLAPASWEESLYTEVAVVDHHRPGDPGHAMPPERYLEGSSLGQVLGLLGQTPTHAQRCIAAADHCLGAAYAGQCPGVSPDELLEHRVRLRGAWLARGPGQGRDAPREAIAEVALGASAVELDGGLQGKALELAWARAVSLAVDCTRRELEVLRSTELAPGIFVKDARGVDLPELPEACAREGVAVLYRMVPPPGARDARVKVGVIGGGDGTTPGAAPLKAFMETWAPNAGLTGIYGAPVRGYAGGYES